MEFVKESVNNEITDWNEWMNKYIYKHSDLYRRFKKLLNHISYETTTNAEINIESPYQIWIKMLRSDNLTIEAVENTSCWCVKLSIPTRKKIILNDMVIAFIDKFGDEYKYVGMPFRCHSKMISEYMNQLI